MNPFLSRLITMSNALKSGSESYRREVKRREKFHSRTTGSIIFLISPFDSIKLKDPEREENKETLSSFTKYLNLKLLCFIVLWDEEGERMKEIWISFPIRKCLEFRFHPSLKTILKEKKLIGFWLEMFIGYLWETSTKTPQLIGYNYMTY